VDVADGALAEQQQVAVPAVVLRPAGEGNRKKAAFALETGEVDQPGAVAEPLVGLLQSDEDA
jgi:hypothetical protein